MENGKMTIFMEASFFPVALVFLHVLMQSNRNLYCQKFNVQIKFFVIK